MITVGITGGIGAGKSHVSAMIRAMGYPVFDSDQTAKLLSDNDPTIKKELIEMFGEGVYTSTGLNRPFLAAQIFKNDEAREKVNKLIHPKVREAFKEFCEKHQKSIVFNEAAILVETGAYRNFDKLVLVTASEKLRLERVMKRDDVDSSEVQKRMAKQGSDSEKRKVADFEIVNDGASPLLVQIEKMIDYLTSSQGSN